MAETLPTLNQTPSNDSQSLEEKYNEKEGSTPEIAIGTYEVDGIYDIKSGDPLPDVSADLPVETSTLTFRAIIVGCALGSVVQASNLYLGLKTGFTFGPQLFGAIFGFVILKSLSKILPTGFGGGYFGEKENVTVQTAATSAGGLGILFVSGIPAMYQLNLLGASPKEDIGKLLALTACCAYYGMIFAIPLRRWYILKQKLVFPTPTATALTIRSLHSGPGGALIAKAKASALMYTFVGSILLRVVSQYAPGIMWDWHPFWWTTTFGWSTSIYADNWGFFWENTPAFLGAGVLTGVNASLSLYFGGIFFWGILGPMLIKTQTCVGRDFSSSYDGYMVWNYNKMKWANAQGTVSPRYWILFPAIFLMIVASFTELGCNGKSIYKGFSDLYKETVNALQVRRGLGEKYVVDADIIDPAPDEDQVPLWAWAGGLVAVIILTVAVMAKAFQLDVGVSILAILLGFIFSFIGVQCSGDTDINPVSTCAKASQLVVGGVTHGQYTSTIVIDPTTQISTNVGAMRVNLVAAIISAGAAAQASDMVGDLKTGHLLKAKPKNMFVAQFCGATVSIFLSVGLFVLFSSAYPCITDSNAPTCPFGIPSVTTWAAVAKATTSTNGLPMPSGSAYFALALSLIGFFVIIAKNFFIPENKRQYVPNMVSFGLAGILPPGQTQYGLCMAVASVACYFWKRRSPKSYDLLAFPIAAGGIAGEGLGGVVNALFVVVGIDGSVYGSAIGCPGNQYCG